MTGESDYFILLVAPFVLAGVLMWLRRRSSRWWWLTFSAYSALALIFILARSHDWRLTIGGMLLYLCPVAAMFLGLRPTIFVKRPLLILPIGIALYIVTLALALSIGVSLGLLQP